ncbi:MAG: hypothetical protein ACXWDO_12200, partial [Bacteroidia bacterium]
QKGKWGAGLRLGDPTGISLKRYGAKTNLELNVGRTYYLYNYGSGRYSYESGFYRYGKFKDKDIYFYDRYDAVSAPIALQLHFMKQKAIKDLKGLDWYIGVGPQFRNQRVKYFYRVKEYYGPDNDDYRWVNTVETVNRLDLGIDGVIGLEYAFDDLPLSIAADATLFMELFDTPFLPWGQAGLAIRYNFK